MRRKFCPFFFLRILWTNTRIKIVTQILLAKDIVIVIIQVTFVLVDNTIITTQYLMLMVIPGFSDTKKKAGKR